MRRENVLLSVLVLLKTVRKGESLTVGKKFFRVFKPESSGKLPVNRVGCRTSSVSV